MKRTFFLLFLISVILIIPVGVSADGNISVSSTPTGATIYLDGASSGVTPAVIDAISGSHTILLRLSGYQDYPQTVVVNDNQSSVVSVSLTAVVAAPTISGISPTSGYNSSIATVTITGTGFSTTPSVVLAQSGTDKYHRNFSIVNGDHVDYVSASHYRKTCRGLECHCHQSERTVRHICVYYLQCRVNHHPVVCNPK